MISKRTVKVKVNQSNARSSKPAPRTVKSRHFINWAEEVVARKSDDSIDY